MKKKLVPILVVLAFVIVGVGAFFLGREFAVPPSLETSPEQSSAPEAAPNTTPDATPVETTTPAEPTPEVAPAEPETVVDAKNDGSLVEVEQSQNGFADAGVMMYAKPSYLKSGGLPVWDKPEWDIFNRKEIWRTSTNPEDMYYCISIGYGEYEGLIYILNTATGEKGYTNATWFTDEAYQDTQEEVVVQPQKPAETQQPTEQKPAQTGGQQSNSSSGSIDYSKIPGAYTPGQNGDTTIPEDQQTHDGGASGTSEDGSIGNYYTGSIGGA